jgi:hypothetical protein
MPDMTPARPAHEAASKDLLRRGSPVEALSFALRAPTPVYSGPPIGWVARGGPVASSLAVNKQPRGSFVHAGPDAGNGEEHDGPLL